MCCLVLHTRQTDVVVRVTTACFGRTDRLVYDGLMDSGALKGDVIGYEVRKLYRWKVKHHFVFKLKN